MVLKDWKKMYETRNVQIVWQKENNNGTLSDELTLRSAFKNSHDFLPEFQNLVFVKVSHYGGTVGRGWSSILFKTEKAQTKTVEEQERAPLTDMDWDMAMNDPSRLNKFQTVKREVSVSESERRKLWLQAFKFAQQYMRRH